MKVNKPRRNIRIRPCLLQAEIVRYIKYSPSYKLNKMERRRSQDKVFFRPARRHGSSDKLPEISSTHGVGLETQSESGVTEGRLPPIARQDGGSQRRENANQRYEKLNYRRSGECIANRRTMSVTNVEVPNPREAMGRGLKRSDAGIVSSGQKTTHVPHPPPSLDAKRTRDRKTAFQRRNTSLSRPASENVIIEEIYLLPRKKSTDSMTQTPRRQGICGHPPLRNTRSDESHGLRGIRSCGEILSRRIYYSDLSVSDSSCLLFGRETIDIRGAMTTELRGAPLRTSPPFIYRENKNGVQTEHVEQKVHLEGETECEQLGATGKQQQQQQQQGPSQLHQENMREFFSRAEACNQDRFPASHHRSSRIVNGKSVVAQHLDRAKEGTHARRMRRYGVFKARPEAQYKEVEYSVGYFTDKSEESQAHQEFCKFSDEAIDKEKESLVRPTSDESEEREMRRHRDATQMRCQRGRGAKDEATNEERASSTSLATDESTEERHGQQMRRQGVCEAVDNTAARRRRARVLKKKLFGDDLPIHDEVLTEEILRRGLNKRL